MKALSLPYKLRIELKRIKISKRAISFLWSLNTLNNIVDFSSICVCHCCHTWHISEHTFAYKKWKHVKNLIQFMLFSILHRLANEAFSTIVTWMIYKCCHYLSVYDIFLISTASLLQIAFSTTFAAHFFRLENNSKRAILSWRYFFLWGR